MEMNRCARDRFYQTAEKALALPRQGLVCVGGGAGRCLAGPSTGGTQHLGLVDQPFPQQLSLILLGRQEGRHAIVYDAGNRVRAGDAGAQVLFITETKIG